MNNNPAKIYERDLKREILPYLSRREIIAIKGPRQAGKTTFLLDIYKEMEKKKKCLYLTFEKQADLEIFQKDIEVFKKIYADNYEVIFIDEFQYAKNGGKNLKYLYDTSNSKFIITGSSSLELTQQTGKYLVGRLLSFYLYPFSFGELLKIKKPFLYKIINPSRLTIKKIISGNYFSLPLNEPLKSEEMKKELFLLLEEYLIWGGYPAVSLAQNEAQKKVLLSGIIETYLLRDIKTLLNLATEQELLTLSKLLSLQIGNLINYEELTNVCKINFKQLKKYLNILKQTYILDFISPYFRNRRTELVKNPKVYFMDSGLNNLLAENFLALKLRTNGGALLENFVYTQLKRKIEPFDELKYWRTKAQAEVDFIQKKGELIIPIEVKNTTSKNIKIGKSYHSFLNKYHPSLGLVITLNLWHKEKIGKTNVYFVPAYYL